MTNDWNKSHRKERFNPGWERTRREVLDYYGWRCQYPVIGDDGVLRPCGAHANEVDHIAPRRNGRLIGPRNILDAQTYIGNL